MTLLSEPVTAPPTSAQPMTLSRDDFMYVLEQLNHVVVSLGNMGRHYMLPEGVELTADQRRDMLEDLHRMFSPELARKLSRARRLLCEQLTDEENEAFGDAVENSYYKCTGEMPD